MFRGRTGDQALVREINLSIILNALRDHSPISRASLAGMTGLNKTTVSSLVQQLHEAGFVSEVGMDRSEDTAGRPGLLLDLNPRAGCIVGAEIGVDFISVVVTDFAIKPVWRHHESIAIHDVDSTLRRVRELVGQAVEASAGECSTPLGVGLGVPGLVDESSGTLLFAPNLGWRDINLRDMLQPGFPFPVYVDNEANMATLGETYFGVARGAKSVLYLSAGVGLGGGIVLDGRILPGSAGYAGEVGHMTLVPDGVRCNCGNRGCWETLVSQEALFRRIREHIASGRVSTLSVLTGGDLAMLTIPLVVEAAEAGDEVALDALSEVAVYLGTGLANLVNALNPGIVVLGGILSLASRFLLPTVRRVVEERALPWSAQSTRVLPSAHGSSACLMGGIATVYHHILSRPFGVVSGDGKVPAGRPRLAVAGSLGVIR